MSQIAQRKLDALRTWRNPADYDQTLAFLPEYHKRHIEKPAKQLADLAEIWEQLIPADLISHTRLESFSRGVLRVAVESSTHLYQLDRLLREGMQRRIIQTHRGPALNRIQLRVATI